MNERRSVKKNPPPPLAHPRFPPNTVTTTKERTNNVSSFTIDNSKGTATPTDPHFPHEKKIEKWQKSCFSPLKKCPRVSRKSNPPLQVSLISSFHTHTCTLTNTPHFPRKKRRDRWAAIIAAAPSSQLTGGSRKQAIRPDLVGGTILNGFSLFPLAF